MSYKITINNSTVGRIVVGDGLTLSHDAAESNDTADSRDWTAEGPDVVISGREVTITPSVSDNASATPQLPAQKSKSRSKGTGQDFRALAAQKLKQRGRIQNGDVRIH